MLELGCGLGSLQKTLGFVDEAFFLRTRRHPLAHRVEHAERALSRKTGELAGEPVGDVPVIAREKLVAAVSRQNDFDFFRRDL